MPYAQTVTLKLEAIADHLADHAKQVRRGADPNRLPRRFRNAALFAPIRQPWVAEIFGMDARQDRVFLPSQKDFSEANSIGSRGVYLYYHLQEGRIYEVRELTSWTRDRRYFCTVTNGVLVEMCADEVQVALNERPEREVGLV